MRQLDIDIRGLAGKDRRLRLRQKRPDRLSGSAKLLLIGLCAGVAAHSIRSDSAPVASIAGQQVTGSRVLVLQDTSGSMGGTGASLDRQLEQLRAAGISAGNKVEIQGFGVMATGQNDNLLNGLERALAANPGVDTVYVFSDFRWVNDPPVDGSDPPGYRRLEDLLSERKLRMYLATVNEMPSAELIRAARESGGGLIQPR